MVTQRNQYITDGCTLLQEEACHIFSLKLQCVALCHMSMQPIFIYLDHSHIYGPVPYIWTYAMCEPMPYVCTYAIS